MNKTRTQEEVQSFTKSASQELNHMSRLLDDLLLLAKIDAGSGSLILSEIRVDEILIDAISRFDVLAKKKGISIRFNLEDKSTDNQHNLFTISADSDLIQSMFRNLLDNAIKYSKNDSIVDVRIINDDKNVFIHVHDFGDPIPVEMQEQIFHRYERGNWPSNRAQGTGLGLTIAQRIAELHGGKIRILQSNSPGKTFEVEMKKL